MFRHPSDNGVSQSHNDSFLKFHCFSSKEMYKNLHFKHFHAQLISRQIPESFHLVNTNLAMKGSLWEWKKGWRQKIKVRSSSLAGIWVDHGLSLSLSCCVAWCHLYFACSMFIWKNPGHFWKLGLLWSRVLWLQGDEGWRGDSISKELLRKTCQPEFRCLALMEKLYEWWQATVITVLRRTGTGSLGRRLVSSLFNKGPYFKI